MTPLDRIRAEIQRVLACATEAHDRPVAETLAWVMSLIDRERNHEALPSQMSPEEVEAMGGAGRCRAGRRRR